MKTWYLDDIIEHAKGFKYTFYVPPNSVIDRLGHGNEVRLRFNIINPVSKGPEAERMWVGITERDGNNFTGLLTNEPQYIGDLKLGDKIHFQTKNIMDSDLQSDDQDLVEKYIHRCFVSNKVLHQKEKVKYLYRNESKGEWKDEIFDSGWVIMSGEESQEYIDDHKNLSVVSLGAVLNIDDSILSVLEEPVGSEFEWSDGRMRFEKVD